MGTLGEVADVAGRDPPGAAIGQSQFQPAAVLHEFHDRGLRAIGDTLEIVRAAGF
jgi:hypothetical protein